MTVQSTRVWDQSLRSVRPTGPEQIIIRAQMLKELNTVKPPLSGHLRDLPKCPLNRGCSLNGGCKNQFFVTTNTEKSNYSHLYMGDSDIIRKPTLYMYSKVSKIKLIIPHLIVKQGLVILSGLLIGVMRIRNSAAFSG